MTETETVALYADSETYVQTGLRGSYDYEAWSDRFRALGGTRSYITMWHQHSGQAENTVRIDVTGTPEAVAFVQECITVSEGRVHA